VGLYPSFDKVTGSDKCLTCWDQQLAEVAYRIRPLPLKIKERRKREMSCDQRLSGRAGGRLVNCSDGSRK